MTASAALVVWLLGSRPLTVASFTREPVSVSSWVIVYVAVLFSRPIGASVQPCAGVQVTAEMPGSESATRTFVSVTLPELRTLKA